MTISIGGLGPQPETQASEFDADRLSSSGATKVSPESEPGLADEATPTLIAGTASISALTSAAMNGDDSRAGRVEQLRQSVAAGAYQLQPLRDIADAVLAEWS
jgi:anti-sigma28 factor (negative regulator of flagellin synthesis)